MPEHTGANGTRRGSPLRIAAWGPVTVLLVPALAMLVTDGVDWTVADFVVAGALLLGVGVGYEVAASRTVNPSYRAGVGLALGAAFTLVWANGAVGIIGSEDNPANLMLGGVPVIGAVGAVIARFRPRGMARALFATALAQALVAAVALVGGFGSASEVLVATAFFAMLWVASAVLFRKAARQQASAGAVP